MDKKMKSKMLKLHKGKPMIDTALIGKKGHNKIMKHRPLGIKKSIGRPRKVPHPVNIMEEKDIKPDIGLGSLLLSDSRITREAVRQKTQKNKDKRDDQPIMCNICKRTYKFKSHLDRHMLTHNNHRPHKCVLCTAAFFDSHLLKRHILSHTGKLPFQCHLCQKQFYTKSEHARHLRVHDGEKPYQCKECSEGFIYNKSLSRHIKIAHSGLKPYSCEVCEETFATFTIMMEHRKTRHEEYKLYLCEICDKRFSKAINLREHYGHHTGLKLYNCRVCGKGFGYPASLRKHLLITDACNNSMKRDSTKKTRKKKNSCENVVQLPTVTVSTAINSSSHIEEWQNIEDNLNQESFQYTNN